MSSSLGKWEGEVIAQLMKLLRYKVSTVAPITKFPNCASGRFPTHVIIVDTPYMVIDIFSASPVFTILQDARY